VSTAEERPESPPTPPERGKKLKAVPSAVLDTAHLGDIEGALGRIPVGETGDERRGFRRRLLTFLAIVGPGLIVMVGDNDAGGVATYAQSGQDYGYSLLWVLLLLIPVLIVNQEMVVRLGVVTGVGHARLINERFGRFWGWFSVGDLFLLNFLTIMTEFIGVSLALAYFGISRYVAVPSFRDAKGFYLTFTALVVVAAMIVLIPGAPLGVVTEAVQALAGLLLPSASVFLLLLCNDWEVLGPRVNRGWLNIIATIIIATLLMLSGTLMATKMFPHVNATHMAIWLSVALGAGMAAAGIVLRVRRGPEAGPGPAERNSWRMPPLAMLKPVTWSPAIKLGMLALRAYLVIAALLLLIKAIQLGAD
jgi:hypothetical protein